MKNNTFLRLTALFALLCMLLSLAVACTGASNTGSDTTVSETEIDTHSETTADPGPSGDVFILTVTGGTFEDGETEEAFPYGEQVTMIADEAVAGKIFQGWRDDEGETIGHETTVTVTVRGDANYTAYFVSAYHVEVVGGKITKYGDKTVSETLNELTCVKNTEITVVADAAPDGEMFVGWKNNSGDIISDKANFVTHVDDRKLVLTAVYAPKATITVSGGTLNGNTVVDCPVGYEITLIADDGTDTSAFDYWKSDSEGKLAETEELTVTVTKDETYTAVFASGCILHTVNAKFNSGSSEKAFIIGRQVTMTAILPKGYRLIKWTNANGDNLGTDTTLTVTVTAADTYTAVTEIVFADQDPANPNAVGTYWKQPLADALTKIENNRKNIASEDLVEFFFITDAHWNGNAGYSPALINYLSEKTGTTKVLYGGDTIVRYNEGGKDAAIAEIEDFFDGFAPNIEVFATLGNHDRNGSSNQPDKEQRLSEAEAYAVYTKRAESFATTVKDDPCVSYFDDTEHKVRFIQFFNCDSMYHMIEDAYVDAGFAWAKERIRELEDGWTVVLLTHGYWRDLDPSDSAETIENGVPSKNKTIRDGLLDLVNESSANIAIWLTGHDHVDYATELNSASVSGGEVGSTFYVVSSAADAYSHSHVSSKLGTATEQSFSYFQIDLKTHTVYSIRIGAGEDRTFTYSFPMT